MEETTIGPWPWRRASGLGFEGAVLRQGSPVGGSCRYRRPLEACEPALRLETAPERRDSLEPNENNLHHRAAGLEGQINLVVVQNPVPGGEA